MGGSFHIAPGKSFSINHIHVHDSGPYSSSSFNTSHVINHLSFGKRMNYAKTSMDDLRVMEPERKSYGFIELPNHILHNKHTQSSPANT